MAIEITAAPEVVEGPAFGGVAIFVPLSEKPDDAWHREFVARELPGKAHRVVEGGLEFCLDRESRDVMAAMRKIAEAIKETDKVYGASGQAEQPSPEDAEQRHQASREKLNRQLEQWWQSQQGS